MSNYNKKEVFDIPMANNTIDLLYYLMQKYIDKYAIEDIDIHTNFVLSGKAAKKLQGGTVADIPSIVFITDFEALYAVILKIVNELPNKIILKFKKKILIENESYFIEIHNIKTPLDIVVIDTIIMQNVSQIPEFLL